MKKRFLVLRNVEGAHLTEDDRSQRILRWWPEILSALAALGALYLYWWHLFAG
jgi:hypothetical protein